MADRRRKISGAAVVRRNEKILADAAAGMSSAALADKYKLSQSRIRTIKAEGGYSSQKDKQAAQAKAAETFAEYLDSKRVTVQKIIDAGLEQMPDKLLDASAVQIATVMGILIDKFAALRGPSSGAEVEDLTPLADLINRPDEEQSAGADAAPAADQDGGGTA